MPRTLLKSAKDTATTLALICTIFEFRSLHAAPQSTPQKAAADVPTALKPPEGEVLMARAQAKGSQIYVCAKDDAKYAWTFKGPQAQLFDKDGRIIGRHYAGPTWEWNDGSQVTGKVAATAPSPDANSIPWLLLTVTARSGSGALTRATSIQRLNTKGGKAPVSSCNVAHEKDEVQMTYSADYLFYGK